MNAGFHPPTQLNVALESSSAAVAEYLELYRFILADTMHGSLCVPIRVHCRHLFCTAGSHGTAVCPQRMQVAARTVWLGDPPPLSNDLTRGCEIIHQFTFGKVT